MLRDELIRFPAGAVQRRHAILDARGRWVSRVRLRKLGLIPGSLLRRLQHARARRGLLRSFRCGRT
jgi:hypothetical protein